MCRAYETINRPPESFMNGDFSLLEICLVAFGLVVILLTLLGNIICLLTRLFPGTVSPKTDPFVIAAIQESVRARFPGARVKEIEPLEPTPKNQSKHDIH